MISVYGTLGPGCDNENVLEQMFREGMTGLRLNLSHTTLKQAEGQITRMQKAARACGIIPELIIDMQGPELRIGVLKQPLNLVNSEFVTIGPDGSIPVASLLMPCLLPEQQILLDDGKLLLRITENNGSTATAEVLRGGVLQSRKSIALLGITVDSPALTQQDYENISNASAYGVTGIMQPFVRGAADLITVKQALHNAGCGDVRLFAKIENRAGIERLDEIIGASDEVVIARGDLGNSMNLWELPAVQKNIAARCRAAGRSFMVVTQMLTSMEHQAVPTRAEVSDIFNAVLDGASSVMVTGETAAGSFPVEVMSYLRKTADEGELFLKQQKHLL